MMQLVFLELTGVMSFIGLALAVEWLMHRAQDQAAMDLAYDLLKNPQRTFGLSRHDRQAMRYYRRSEQLIIFTFLILLWLPLAQALALGGWDAFLPFLLLYIYLLTSCLLIRWHMSWHLHNLLVRTYGTYHQAAHYYSWEESRQQRK